MTQADKTETKWRMNSSKFLRRVFIAGQATASASPHPTPFNDDKEYLTMPKTLFSAGENFFCVMPMPGFVRANDGWIGEGSTLIHAANDSEIGGPSREECDRPPR